MSKRKWHRCTDAGSSPCRSGFSHELTWRQVLSWLKPLPQVAVGAPAQIVAEATPTDSTALALDTHSSNVGATSVANKRQAKGNSVVFLTVRIATLEFTRAWLKPLLQVVVEGPGTNRG
jgi:hypothetical protein